MSLLNQSGGSEPESKSALRSILPYTTVLTILVALYVGWIFFSRYQENKTATEQAQQKQESARQQTDADITQHGQLTFTTFYASDAVINKGQSTRLCYGVINAKTVTLDPPVEQAHPTDRHCLDISPEKTTTYKITADDGRGQSKTLSITVRVR